MKIVGVTACPSGVAHTYMAAEALKLAGEKYDVKVLIETQGGSGTENPLDPKDIAEADCVIISNDIDIKGIERFKGKPCLKKGVSVLIKQSDQIIKALKDKFE
ncbi:PTS fructose transporter subunit IIB [Bacillus changyiensis]|uniref:PTS fructose transporter subunit IIB n=1 Tax=Bacillus changyiensis TaxID=3004103 RepID=UPI0022E95ABA|nr:PTS fructose transporter subunit IIB [Bacillus changyiensis]MDA1477233.1 PTS fructose transporter subunit IIB [Bacillus changyiensis]